MNFCWAFTSTAMIGRRRMPAIFSAISKQMRNLKIVCWRPTPFADSYCRKEGCLLSNDLYLFLRSLNSSAKIIINKNVLLHRNFEIERLKMPKAYLTYWIFKWTSDHRWVENYRTVYNRALNESFSVVFCFFHMYRFRVTEFIKLFISIRNCFILH